MRINLIQGVNKSMIENFAAFHVIGEKKTNVSGFISDLTKIPQLSKELTVEQIERLDYLKQMLGEDFICEFKKSSFNETWMKRSLVGIESSSGYSFFSPYFEMDTIEYEIALFYGYSEAPIVLGVGVEDGRYFRICIYNNCRVEADWLVDLKPDCTNRNIHEPRSKNIKSFEKIFGITKKDFNNIREEKSLPYAFLYFKRFVDFRLELSYDDIIKNLKKYNADRYF